MSEKPPKEKRKAKKMVFETIERCGKVFWNAIKENWLVITIVAFVLSIVFILLAKSQTAQDWFREVKKDFVKPKHIVIEQDYMRNPIEIYEVFGFVKNEENSNGKYFLMKKRKVYISEPYKIMDIESFRKAREEYKSEYKRAKKVHKINIVEIEKQDEESKE